MQRAGIALLGSALIALTGLWLATAFIADVFAHQRALGAPLVMLGDQPVYAPWAILAWTSARMRTRFPGRSRWRASSCSGAFMLALLPIAVAARAASSP
ncbi:MAG: hypothetical protein IPL62_19395 [Caulobacteraceae bacterium]|nr:hypothetical protein [Caulobacteraceae bacterium]